MICPKCACSTRSIEGTYVPEDSTVYRLRECRSCGYSFYTAELVVEYGALVRDAFARYPSHIGYATNRKLPITAVKVRCLDTGKVFESASAAGRAIDIHRSAITLCCQGKRKRAGGMRWEYYKEDEKEQEE